MDRVCDVTAIFYDVTVTPETGRYFLIVLSETGWVTYVNPYAVSFIMCCYMIDIQHLLATYETMVAGPQQI